MFNDALAFFDSITRTHKDFIKYVVKHPYHGNKDVLRYALRLNLEEETNSYLNTMKERFKDDAGWEERLKPILLGIVEDEVPNFETAAVRDDANYIRPITKDERELIDHFVKFAVWAIEDKEYEKALEYLNKSLEWQVEVFTSLMESHLISNFKKKNNYALYTFANSRK